MTEEDIARAVIAIRKLFPGLAAGAFEVTSPIDELYNCIALAAGDESNWWWPGGGYWPDGAPVEVTLSAFIEAFMRIGYAPCADGAPEPTAEKVAIYGILPHKLPKHAARQLADGRWLSKLGMAYDIIHESTAGIEGELYGSVLQYMRRLLP